MDDKDTTKDKADGKKSSSGGSAGAASGLVANTSNSKYAVVRDALRSRGFRLILDKEDTDSTFDLYWQDGYLQGDRLMRMHSYQRANHWPGMFVLHRKDGLARTLRRMMKVFPKEFDFVPQTWVLPDNWAVRTTTTN